MVWWWWQLGFWETVVGLLDLVVAAGFPRERGVDQRLGKGGYSFSGSC